jgi:hypothetical protein
MVTKVGSIQEWYRFLDARSTDEAVAELRRHVARIDTAYAEVENAFRRLAYCPGGEVDELLMIARTSLSEAVEMLQQVTGRFRAGEHQIA